MSLSISLLDIRVPEHTGSRILLLSLVLSLALVFTVDAEELDNESCFFCHGETELTKELPDGRTVSMYVDQEAYAASVHAPLDCVFCHLDIEEVPHEPDLEPAQCAGCHDETEEYAASVHGVAIGAGDIEAARCQDCHGTHDMRSADDPLSLVHPTHLPTTCGICHSDPALSESHLFSQAHPTEDYLKSQHSRAIQSGRREDAATCNDCHGTHDIQASHKQDSRVFAMNIPNTCAQCHEKAVGEFQNSIHGKALAAGVKDAPNCTTCHGEHGIIGPESEDSQVSPRRVSHDTCLQCHAEEKTMEKFGIATHKQASYMDSFHGLTGVTGAELQATCIDCHGVHDILPQDDPKSNINKANLVETCAQCHENANENFAQGSVHIMATDSGQKVMWIVRIAYIWLIALVLGGMLIHNVLLLLRYSLPKLFEERKKRGSYKRFNRGEVIGHFLLFVSFTALAISGFALRYPETWFTRVFFFGELGLEYRGLIHRISAVAFVIVTSANLLYITMTRRGRSEVRALMIIPRDISDVFKNLAYAVGLRKNPPQFGRYGYKEKFEYWGLWWGSILMIVTGFCMWFANWFLGHWPKIVLDIMALVHFYEAWLAVGTIIIWHMYHMILDPEAYPMNWSWITGRITIEELKEHHPLEYEQVKAEIVEGEEEK